jgi:division protein CdvB (Snf7/Vps24/ESCRT-III family)
LYQREFTNLAPNLNVFSPGGTDAGVKDKINGSLRQIEIQRKELQTLKARLDDRRRVIFESTIRAIEKSDEMTAQVLEGEHAELLKIIKVVMASELALLHICVRLETIRDVGDIMSVLSNAFKSVKKVGKSVSEIAPNMEQAAAEINGSFSNILTELKMVSPNVNISLTDSPNEIFEKAQKLIGDRTLELENLPRNLTEVMNEESIYEKSKKIALLETEGDDSENDEEFKPELYSSGGGFERPVARDPESAVRNYLSLNGGSKMDVVDASAQLNLPVDLVEQAYIKVLADKRFFSHTNDTRRAGDS